MEEQTPETVIKEQKKRGRPKIDAPNGYVDPFKDQITMASTKLRGMWNHMHDEEKSMGEAHYFAWHKEGEKALKRARYAYDRFIEAHTKRDFEEEDRYKFGKEESKHFNDMAGELAFISVVYANYCQREDGELLTNPMNLLRDLLEGGQ